MDLKDWYNNITVTCVEKTHLIYETKTKGT